MKRINENDITNIPCPCNEVAPDYSIESPYIKTTLIACLVSNDFKHIHLHATGKQFDRIHNIAQEYYEKVSEELDYLCELSLEHEGNIVNLTIAKQFVPEYQIQEFISYDYCSSMNEMYDIVVTYLSFLCSLRDYTTDSSEQSYLDDEIRYWEKETRYKLSRRLSDSNSSKEEKEIVNVPMDEDEIVETTQCGSIGQHKDTNTKSYPPISKSKDLDIV